MTDVPFINANHWICGHDHQQVDFEKAGVHFHMNAIGYIDEYEGYRRNEIPPTENVNSNKRFGVKTIET